MTAQNKTANQTTPDEALATWIMRRQDRDLPCDRDQYSDLRLLASAMLDLTTTERLAMREALELQP